MQPFAGHQLGWHDGHAVRRKKRRVVCPAFLFKRTPGSFLLYGKSCKESGGEKVSERLKSFEVMEVRMTRFYRKLRKKSGWRVSKGGECSREMEENRNLLRCRREH